MDNNKILRQLRYTFDICDNDMIKIFALADKEVSRSDISDWLKREEDSDFKEIEDVNLAIFLNGFITHNRGKKEGAKPEPENELNNNLILRKLKIALNLRSEDILDILKLADLRVSKSELSSFFRRRDHRHFQECKDQILRNFLKGLQFRYRPSANQSKEV